MIYSYRCQACSGLHEEIHPMSNFPRETVCEAVECGGLARLVILHSPLFSIDRTSEEGFNHGAGQYFKSKSDRTEWMKRTKTVDIDPRTGDEVESGIREVYPEESVVEKAYLKDYKEAVADKAPPPVHPGFVRQNKLAEERTKENLEKARPKALQFVADTVTAS